MKHIEGMLQAGGTRVAIVVGRFNAFINEQLLAGAVDCFVRHGGSTSDITVIKVPGAFELPLMINKLLQTKPDTYDGLVALGTLIRGGTSHFELIASECVKGIAQSGIEHGVPISFGVITTESIEQAIERAGTKAGNKGSEAMLATIEMMDLYQKIKNIF